MSFLTPPLIPHLCAMDISLIFLLLGPHTVTNSWQALMCYPFVIYLKILDSPWSTKETHRTSEYLRVVDEWITEFSASISLWYNSRPFGPFFGNSTMGVQYCKRLERRIISLF